MKKSNENQRIVEQDTGSIQESCHSMEECYRIAAQNSNELILEYDVVRNSILFATKKVEQVYGIPQAIENGPEFIVGSGVILPESVNEFLELFCKVRTGVPQSQCILRSKSITGETLWGEVILTTIFGRDGRAAKAIGVLRDITREMELEIEYKRELRYNEVIRKCALLTYEVDISNNRMLSGLEKTLEPFHVVPSQHYDEAMEQMLRYLVWEEDWDYIKETFDLNSLIEQHRQGNDKVEGEYRRNVNGQPRWVRCTVYLSYDRHAKDLLGYYYIHDIHDLKLEELRLREQTQQDALTGIYNKSAAELLIRKVLEKEPEEGRVSALFLLDINHFQGVNDHMGRVFGDAVLAEIAQRLKSQFRSDDIVGRVEKDIFILFIHNLPDSEAAKAKAQGIGASFKYAYEGVLKDYRITVSMGIAIFPDHGIGYETLYRKAELALLAAKKSERICVCYDEANAQEYTKQNCTPVLGERCFGKKAFLENISEYVFHILYDSNDVQKAITTVLELISESMGFSRGYIYESCYHDCTCTNTYEWTADGIPSLKQHYKTMSGSLHKKYEKRFANQSFYMEYGEGSLFLEENGQPEFDNLHSRIQFALCAYEKSFYGFIGFDQCDGLREITGPEVVALQDTVQIIDTFLWKQRMISKLSEQDKMLEAVTESWKTCTYIIDPHTYMLRFVNNHTKRLRPQAVPGALCYETIQGKSSPCEDCPFINMMCSDLREYKKEMYLEPYHAWAKIHAMLIEVAGGKEFAVFNGFDFTDELDRDRGGELLSEAGAFTGDVALYRALCHSTDDYIFMCDMNKNLFYFPQPMVEEFDLPSKVIEDAIPLWAARIHENDRKAFMEDIVNLLEGKSNIHNIEYRARNKDGNWVWLRCRGYLQTNENTSLFAGVITNMGKKSKIDYLSGLPNKYEFELYVRSQLSDYPAGGDILLMGLDNFKNINNLYGWEFGDHVIRQSAEKIQRLLPDAIQLYRLDGDCFGVFLVHDGTHQMEAVYKVVSKVFAEQQEFEDHRYFCTISGGYASGCGAKTSFHALFKQAEFALEYSKMEGKNRLSHYDTKTMGEKERTLGLIEALRESVDQGCEGFELYFQPQIKAKTRVIESAEALLRWRCAKYGVISPAEFIPLLEDTGLIQKVGRWVILRAAEVSWEWRKKHPHFAINVNVSYAQLQDKGFLPFIEKAVDSGKLLPEAIHMELTESCIATGSQVLRESFEKLRKMGFCMELDDFGTGYSALELLKTTPADVVKIDRTFVTEILHSSFDATFIQFVVALCHSVNILVCLEGVETWEEYQMVEAMDVDLIQGFLFGRPQSRSDFENKYLNQQEDSQPKLDKL